MSDDNIPKKLYKLLGADGEFYYSEEPGTLGGNFIKKNDKIYGRLDCPVALASLKKPNSTYPKYRVFFKDEATAIAAGYRPCGTCMPEQYKEWKQRQSSHEKKLSDNTPKKLYKLLGADGEFYYSETPGTVDGWTTGKIYHRSDCSKTKSELSLGHLKETLVSFKDEATAIAAGYRPCYFCLREKYTEWKQRQQ